MKHAQEPLDSRRGRLGFCEAGRSAFTFLEDLGFSLEAVDSTYLRYVSSDRFVNVSHGRLSYELGVEIGRWVRVDGVLVEQRIPLYHLAVILGTSSVRSVLTATTRAQVAKFVGQLAEATRELLPSVLGSSSDAVFEQVRAFGAQEAQLFLQEHRLTVLRERADRAWHANDFVGVVLAYREVVSELPMVELRPSELGRLRFAEEHVDLDGSTG